MQLGSQVDFLCIMLRSQLDRSHADCIAEIPSKWNMSVNEGKGNGRGIFVH